MTCIYCNATETENTEHVTICATCGALALLMGGGLRPADDTEAGKVTQEILPVEKVTAFQWPHLTLPASHTRAQFSWVQVFSQKFASPRPWWMKTPGSSGSTGNLQGAEKLDVSQLPTLRQASLISMRLPSKSGVRAALPHSPLASTRLSSRPEVKVASQWPSKPPVPRSPLASLYFPPPIGLEIAATQPLPPIRVADTYSRPGIVKKSNLPLLSTLPCSTDHELLALSALPTMAMPNLTMASGDPVDTQEVQQEKITEVLETPPQSTVPLGEQRPPAYRKQIHVPAMYSGSRALIPRYRAISGFLSLIIVFTLLSVAMAYDAKIQSHQEQLLEPGSATVAPDWNAIDKGPAYDIIPFAQTTSRVDPNLGIALQPDTLFHAGKVFYVAYSVQRPTTTGIVTVKWYIDHIITQTLTSIALPANKVSNGYASILYTIPSAGEVELYWNNLLAQRLYFTVQ